MTKELKIGEVLEYNGKKYVVEHDGDCKKCAFFKISCSSIDELGSCLAVMRKDNRNIIFTEVNNIQDETK